MNQGQQACPEQEVVTAMALPTDIWSRIARHFDDLGDTARLMGVCKASSRLQPPEDELLKCHERLQSHYRFTARLGLMMKPVILQRYQWASRKWREMQSASGEPKQQ